MQGGKVNRKIVTNSFSSPHTGENWTVPSKSLLNPSQPNEKVVLFQTSCLILLWADQIHFCHTPSYRLSRRGEWKDVQPSFAPLSGCAGAAGSGCSCLEPHLANEAHLQTHWCQNQMYRMSRHAYTRQKKAEFPMTIFLRHKIQKCIFNIMFRTTLQKTIFSSQTSDVD